MTITYAVWISDDTDGGVRFPEIVRGQNQIQAIYAYLQVRYQSGHRVADSFRWTIGVRRVDGSRRDPEYYSLGLDIESPV